MMGGKQPLEEGYAKVVIGALKYSLYAGCLAGIMSFINSPYAMQCSGIVIVIALFFVWLSRVVKRNTKPEKPESTDDTLHVTIDKDNSK